MTTRELLFIEGSSEELDSDVMLNRSICFKEEVEEEDETEGWVLTKTYCAGKYRMFYNDTQVEGEVQWWIEDSAANTLTSIRVV